MASPLEQIQNLLQCELMALNGMSDVSYHMLKQSAMCNGTRIVWECSLHLCSQWTVGKKEHNDVSGYFKDLFIISDTKVLCKRHNRYHRHEWLITALLSCILTLTVIYSSVICGYWLWIEIHLQPYVQYGLHPTDFHKNCYHSIYFCGRMQQILS